MADLLARSVDARRARLEAFDLRQIHPHVRFGTASDRYAGWIGQIYPTSYADRVTSRKRALGGQTFEERMLPVESVAHYFEHFEVLELDFTFYRPLHEADGTPTNNAFVLEQYATHAPPEARFLLKAPQVFFSRTLRRSRDGRVRYEDNPAYLDAAAYTRQFHEPARAILGDRLIGVIFEQAYQRVADSPPPEAMIAELDAFFRDVPDDVQAHLELRSEHLLVPPYFAWLADRGLGFVFSHWTWLPPLRTQWRLCGGSFSARNDEAVVRLLTPRNVKYAEAYARAYPFDRPVPAISASREGVEMVLDTTALVFQAEAQQARLHVIANNRAWGNAPDLARTIGHRILDEEVRRGRG
ncbi:hypothetical protein AWN76_004920 [Rhodothermaceae bacterium RA]|nr:hypothetical protein AWN76_004920 [Rhodothermaceae bacterium RA]